MEADASSPSPEVLQNMRDSALAQMKFARNYVHGLLDSVPDSLWGVFPNGMRSHFAWQVCHLAVAQYGLMLFRQRGRIDGDIDLMPGWLRKKFGKGTVPSIDEVPERQEAMELLRRIHEESLRFDAQLSAEVLSEPTEMPYAGYPIKLGAILFCPLHESIHAGQIGILRRLHGLDPVR